MKRERALSVLRQHRDEIRQRFAVRQLALFGSTARDEAREDSDVDVLVDFEDAPTFDGYIGLLAYLEERLGHKVDLVTQGGLKPRARRFVERDLIHVP
jgi:predicted nucleotidyltransferase